jgi:rod shape-determining protein MreB
VKAEVRGRDLMSGLPKTVILTPEEVREAIAEPVSAIVASVISCLGEAPPELAHDLIVRGMHLVGRWRHAQGPGQAHRRGDRASRSPSSTQPLECVVMGAGRCIEHYDQLRVMFMGAR